MQVSVIAVYPFLLAMEAGQLNSDVDEDVPEKEDDGLQRPTGSFDPIAGYEYAAYNTDECRAVFSTPVSAHSRSRGGKFCFGLVTFYKYRGTVGW